MARVTFTSNLFQHIQLSECSASGATVREVMDAVFSLHPSVRSYIVDDQGAVRKHIAVFLDGQSVPDRAGLKDAVRGDSEICIMQALSGG